MSDIVNNFNLPTGIGVQFRRPEAEFRANDAIMIQSTKNAVFPKTRLRTSFCVNKHKEAVGFCQPFFSVYLQKKTVIKENCVFVLRVMIASFCEMMRSFFSEYRLETQSWQDVADDNSLTKLLPSEIEMFILLCQFLS